LDGKNQLYNQNNMLDKNGDNMNLGDKNINYENTKIKWT